ARRAPPSFPTRRSSDLFPFTMGGAFLALGAAGVKARGLPHEYALTPHGVRLSRGTDTFLLPASALREFTLTHRPLPRTPILRARSEEHTSELQSRENLV